MSPNADAARSSRGLTVAIAIAVVVAGVLTYANAFPNAFVWDDASFVLRQTKAPEPYNIAPLFTEDQHAYGRGQGNFYRPLVAASYVMDFAFSSIRAKGVSPSETGAFCFHRTNLLFHLAAALLLLALLRRAGAPALVQATVPALYAVHPLHTEAVAYISGRADPMAAAGMFAALWFALWNGRTSRQWFGAALSAVFFTLALLCKESAFIYPVLLLLFLLLRPNRSAHDGDGKHPLRWAAFAMACAILAAYAALRMTVLDFGSDAEPVTTGLAQRIVETLQAFAIYCRLVFVPTGLHMERTLDGATWTTAAAGAGLLLAVLGLLVIALLRGQRRIALGFAWFLAAWLPISGVFPLNAPMAEHWMYVPLAGFLWAFVEVLHGTAATKTRRHAATAAMFALGLFWMSAAIDRNRDWRDNATLFEATLAQNPNSTRVHYNLAVTYQDLLGNMPGAKRHYESVLALYQKKKAGTTGPERFWDQELESHLSLGDMALAEYDYNAAAPHYEVLLKATPTTSPIHGAAAFGMGRCFLGIGDTAQAKTLFARAVEITPELRDQVNRLLPGSVPANSPAPQQPSHGGAGS